MNPEDYWNTTTGTWVELRLRLEKACLAAQDACAVTGVSSFAVTKRESAEPLIALETAAYLAEWFSR